MDVMYDFAVPKRRCEVRCHKGYDQKQEYAKTFDGWRKQKAFGSKRIRKIP